MAAGEHDIHNTQQNTREKKTLSVLCGCTDPDQDLPQAAKYAPVLSFLGCSERSFEEGLKAARLQAQLSFISIFCLVTQSKPVSAGRLRPYSTPRPPSA